MNIVRDTLCSTSLGSKSDVAQDGCASVAIIDYNRYDPEARRQDIEYVNGSFTLVRQTNATIGRQAGGR